MLGGNSNNLINSLLFFSLKSVWLCNGGGGVTFDANTKKLKPIGATFSVLWCYSIYFSIFVVWMKGILWYYSTTSGLLTFPHPVWSRWMLHNSAFFFLFVFLCLFVTRRWFLHALAPRTMAIVISRFCGPHRNVGMRRGCQGCTVGSVYRSKDAALCCRDHGCNIKTVGLIHDGAAASAVQTLPPKYLSVEKSESKIARRQQPPKKLLVAYCFFPSSVIMHSLRLWPLV